MGIGTLFLSYQKKERDKFHEENAIAIDKWGNVFLAPLFNKIMITKEGYQFGNSDETISSVVGKNLRMGTLTKKGELLNSILNKIDPNHAIKSIEENP